LSSLGLALLGFACANLFVPLLPQIIESVRVKEGISESGTINDKASAIFNTAYGFGCTIAPILGGYLCMLTNFRLTCDIMALASASFGAIFFVIMILVPYCCKKR
jgi:MFS family permease